jgi:hypothetical protein
MAEKNDKQVEMPEEVKTTTPIDTDTPAPEMDKTESGEQAATTDENDISDIIDILKEIQSVTGGKGEITSIPPELLGIVKFLIEKMATLKNHFEDPLFKAVLDDMVFQSEEGQTPSFLVAVARNVPMDELEAVADNENYGDVQQSVADKLNKEKEAGEAEEELFAKFDKSKAEFEAYCTENSLSDEAKSALWGKVVMLMKIFGDGYISKKEYAEVDKMNNYDNDIAGLKKQLPEKPKKEVLPDKASIDAAMNPAPVQKSQPRNSMERMVAMQPATDITEIGKRKRKPM